MNRRALAFAMATIAFCGGAFGQEAPAPAPPANPIQTADDCVSSYAKQFEVSGEAANVVAEAAIAKCAREIVTASKEAKVNREEMKNSMRESALVEVVEMRAARNAPKPTPPPPPEPHHHVNKKHHR